LILIHLPYRHFYKCNNNNKRIIKNRAKETNDSATLTRRGCKGGLIERQVHQDRAITVSPFLILFHDRDDGSNAGEHAKDLLLGFSGPGINGHYLSQYTTSIFPKVLANHLLGNNHHPYSLQSKRQQQMQELLALDPSFIY